MIRISLLILCLFCWQLTGFSQELSWQEIPSEINPEERHENAMVQAGDKILLIGGRGQKPVGIFDLNQKTWSKGAHPPVEIHHMQAVNLDGLVYVIAGFTGSWPHETPLTHVLIYDPLEDLWAIGPKIPPERRRGAAGAVVYNRKIYLVNGIINGHKSGWVNQLDEFDPYTNIWKSLPSSPRARDHFHAAVIEDKLYVAGGRRSGSVEGDGFAGTVKETDAYDFKTEKWESLPAIPTPRAGSATAALDGKLLVLGGESQVQEKAHAEVEAFDPETGSWEGFPEMKNGRHGTQAVVINDRVIIGAGSGNRGGGPELNDLEVLTAGEPDLTAEPLEKSELTSASNEISFTGEKAEVEISNSQGNTALVMSYIRTDYPEVFQIKTPLETPFILAPGEAFTIEITAKDRRPSQAKLFVKCLGNSAPLEIRLEKD